MASLRPIGFLTLPIITFAINLTLDQSGPPRTQLALGGESKAIPKSLDEDDQVIFSSSPRPRSRVWRLLVAWGNRACWSHLKATRGRTARFIRPHALPSLDTRGAQRAEWPGVQRYKQRAVVEEPGTTSLESGCGDRMNNVGIEWLCPSYRGPPRSQFWPSDGVVCWDIDLDTTRYPGLLQGVKIPENKRSAHDDERDTPCRWIWASGRKSASSANGMGWHRSWVFSVRSCMMQIESHKVERCSCPSLHRIVWRGAKGNVPPSTVHRFYRFIWWLHGAQVRRHWIGRGMAIAHLYELYTPWRKSKEKEMQQHVNNGAFWIGMLSQYCAKDLGGTEDVSIRSSNEVFGAWKDEDGFRKISKTFNSSRHTMASQPSIETSKEHILQWLSYRKEVPLIRRASCDDAYVIQ